METQTFQDKDMQYAYRSIHDFFDSYHLWSAVTEVQRTIKAAAYYKACKLHNPYRPIYFMEKLELLVNAAFSITKSYLISDRTMLTTTTATGDPDLLRSKDFVSTGRYATIWNNMPRHLTAAQYQQPWKALKKFTAYRSAEEWKQTCKDMAEYALTNNAIDEEYPCYQILGIRLHLLRLIEACHLLEIRSKRPQLKTQQKATKKRKYAKKKESTSQ